jgi:hypothetical protein
LELEPQEIRHALFQGNATKFLKKLAESEAFRLATGESIKSDRMLDREFVLRFIAFRQLGIENFVEGMDHFLNQAMELLNQYDDQELVDLENKFALAMNLAREVFGDKAFRKVFSKNNRRNPINIALFETWSVIFSLLETKDIRKLQDNKSKLFDRFKSEMDTNTTFATQDLNSAKKHAIAHRYEMIRKIVREVINS